MFPRFNVLGIGVHAVCLRQASPFLLNAASEKQKGYVAAVGVSEIMRAQQDSALRMVLNSSILTVADNCAIATVGRLSGFPCMTPMHTPQLILQVCRLSIPHGFTHFFVSGTQGVAEKIGTEMQDRCKDILVVGTHSTSNGSLTDKEEALLVSQLRATQPDFLWVSLESPEQEQFIARCMTKLESGIVIGVGESAFKVLSGEKTKLRPANRLAVVSRQLWTSLVAYSQFAVLIAAQFLRLKRYNLPGSSTPVQPNYTLPRAA